MTRHLLDLSDAGGDAIAAMINDAIDRKSARKVLPKGKPDADRPLEGRVLAMIFEKNSTRTRVSFDMAMRQLGGTSLVLDAASTQLGRGETIADTARVLSRMVDAIMIRTDDHAKAEEMARHATVPVINGLTDRSHPCQIVADLLTIVERSKALTAAASAADVVVTDTWVSMGQDHAAEKLAAMEPYQVNATLMRRAKPDAIFLHCLPAHIGEEVTQDVFESAQSAVFDEAENRIHAQKSILLWAFGLL